MAADRKALTIDADNKATAESAASDCKAKPSSPSPVTALSRDAAAAATDELATDLLWTVFGALRLSKPGRRKSLFDWHARSSLSTEEGASARDNLYKCVVATVAARLRVPLKLSRFRLVARVLLVLVIGYTVILTPNPPSPSLSVPTLTLTLTLTPTGANARTSSPTSSCCSSTREKATTAR